MATRSQYPSLKGPTMSVDKLLSDFHSSVAELPHDKTEVLEFHTEGEVHFTVAVMPRGEAAPQLVLNANPEHAGDKPSLFILAHQAPMVLRKWIAHYLADRKGRGQFRKAIA